MLATSSRAKTTGAASAGRAKVAARIASSSATTNGASWSCTWAGAQMNTVSDDEAKATGSKLGVTADSSTASDRYADRRPGGRREDSRALALVGGGDAGQDGAGQLVSVGRDHGLGLA